MNFHNIAVVYLKELRDTLRDRRTIITMFVIPTVIMPLIVFGFGFAATKVVKKARAEIPAVMILGGADSPAVHEALAAHEKLKIMPASDDYRQQISDKKVRAAVEIPAGFDAMLVEGEAAAVKIYHYEGEIKSGFAAGELDRFFRDYREKTIAARLAARDLPATLLKPFEITRQNVAPPEKVGGSLIGGFIPYVIILLCFTGAMYPAMDLTAGEKERGTMETILCSPVGRTELVLGKFLMVLTGSLSTVALAGLSAAITIPVGGLLLSRSAGAAAAAGAAAKSGATIPMIDLPGLLASLVMVLPVAVLFAAVIFTLALFAKSYKEAQSTVSPLVVVVILPALAGMLPGVELSPQLALIPLLNVSLACKELVSGVFHWNTLALIFGSTCVYAAAALALAVRMFNREDVIFRA
ncbi:MAG TPA: ABC transporter permease [Opitutaceae bacterium]